MEMARGPAVKIILADSERSELEMRAQDPHSGALFAFKGKRGDLIKLLWWDGQGLCLFAKRLEKGRFIWPMAATGTVAAASRESARGSAGAVTLICMRPATARRDGWDAGLSTLIGLGFRIRVKSGHKASSR
jgi:hypothetical protein